MLKETDERPGESPFCTVLLQNFKQWGSLSHLALTTLLLAALVSEKTLMILYEKTALLEFPLAGLHSAF